MGNFIIPIVKTATGGSGNTKYYVSLTAAANHQVKIRALIVGFYGTDTVQAPVACQLIRCSAAGTGTAITFEKTNDSDADSADATANICSSTNPTTTGSPVFSLPVHPQQSIFIPFFDHDLIVGAGDHIAFRTVNPSSPAGVTVDIEGQLWISE